MNRGEREHDTDLEQRARQLFAESVAGVDAATRSRLRRARAQAVAAARSGAGPRLNPGRWRWAGAAAAALLAAVLWWPGTEDAVAPVVAPVFSDLDILLDGEALDLFEDLEFYAWLLQQPEMLELDAAGDGSG